MSMRKPHRLLPALFVVSLFLSTPSLLRIPRMIPFFDADVRAAAPVMLAELREQGLWLVNTDLSAIEVRGKQICFQWQHQYTSVERTFAPELLTTCTND